MQAHPPFKVTKHKRIGPETYASVGSWAFTRLEKERIGPKTYASVLLAALNGPRSTLA